jgi:rSAM/selenodomain-associated transferase 2
MISIITPVLNEEENIRPFLSHIDSLEGDFELILVDGGSSDLTVEEARKWGDSFNHELTILGTDRGRGKQMNIGADAAQGDILLFLHVDCSLKKDALIIIEKAIHEKNAIGGGFMQAFSNPDFFLKFQSAFGNLRAGMTGIFFGDFGIFLKSEIFWKIGGYDEIPFLEDVELCRKVKRHGRLVQINRRIVTSPRRYSKKGKLKLTFVFILANLFNTIRWRPMFLWKYIVD